MTQPLREVLAFLDVRVRGTDAVKRANSAVDGLRDNLHKALSAPGGDDMFSQAMRRTRFEPRKTAAELQAIQNRTTGFVAGFNKMHVAIGAAMAGIAMAVRPVVDAVHRTIAEVIQLGDALDAQAKQTGLSTGALQQWQFIAERGNVDADLLVGSMSRLQRTAFASPRAFRALGVSVRGANGQVRDADDLFRATGIALSQIEDPAERAARAQALFGKQGRALLPIFADGEEGLEALIARFHELGGGLSDDVVAGAAGADDALVDFRLAMTGMKGVLAGTVLPWITKLIDAVSSVVAWFTDLARSSHIIEATLGVLAVSFAALGTAAFLAFLPITAPILLVIAALAGMVLVVDDVITAFSGGRSVIGSFVESLLKSMGVSVTFVGMLERFGIAWELVKAQVLESVAGILGGIDRLQSALGVTLFEGLGRQAGEAARAAAASRGEAGRLSKEHVLGEAGRLRERAADAEARRREIEADGAVRVRVKARDTSSASSRRGRGGGGNTVHSPITINSENADAVARKVVEHQRRMLREADDSMPEPA